MAGKGPRQRDKGLEQRPGVCWRPREPSGKLSRVLWDGAQDGEDRGWDGAGALLNQKAELSSSDVS